MRKFLLLSGLFFTSNCFSQKIKGRITDVNGHSLPFASVFVKGTNQGTTANSEGKYTLKLANGNYVLICQHVGYKREERPVTISSNDIELNFTLSLQEMIMAEVVVKNAEDPAYQIIRNTIKKKSYYNSQLRKFECEVYTKGQFSLRRYPKKFMGQKVDFEDGDTSQQKMVYLSETISKYAVEKPNKEKIEVISSRVSGQSDGFGLAAPGFFSFNENIISIGNNLNPRGFISPISDNALSYYRYKLEGTYFEEGQMINHIRVTPKRKFEPLFSGYVDIVDGDWRMHSLKLLLTKSSQMELLDTLRMEQLYRPLTRDVWCISSQVIYPAAKILGFDGYGSFVNVYTNFNIEPAFNKKSFTNIIVKYLDSANKKSVDYWERTRPIPLREDEEKDYRKKDSLEQARKDPRYLDSLDRKRNKTSPAGILLSGYNHSWSRSRTTFRINPLIEQVRFNPAEGWLLNPEMTLSHRMDTTSSGRRSVALLGGLRYGFSNKHFNGNLGFNYAFGKKYSNLLSFSGGSGVFQFNNNSPIGERGNTLSCLLNHRNRIKSYEATYFSGSFRKGLGEGFSMSAGFQYQDRGALDNTTEYSWRKGTGRVYTPNYPSEIMAQNIERHQVFQVSASIRFQPGTRYIELPERTMSMGSKYPVFTLQYQQAFEDLFGSDVGYAKWKFTISDNINFHLLGRLRYRFAMGGFLDTGKLQKIDYNHFNGNVSTFATDYLNSFQVLPIYQFSNTNKFYALVHVEHNFNGLLTNKIPGIKRLNVYLVAGSNAFAMKGTHYIELFAGVENIFKRLRVDFVQSFLDGKSWLNGIRIGIKR